MDVPATPPSAKKTAIKPRKLAKPALYPQYSVMITTAITSLKERGGSSRQAILKYIMANYKVGVRTSRINNHVKAALKAGIKAGTFKQTKGTGACGSFRLGEKKRAAAKPKKLAKKNTKAVSKKTADKKPKTTAAKKAATSTPKKAPRPKTNKFPVKKASKKVVKVAKPKMKTPKKAAAKI